MKRREASRQYDFLDRGHSDPGEAYPRPLLRLACTGRLVLVAEGVCGKNIASRRVAENRRFRPQGIQEPFSLFLLFRELSPGNSERTRFVPRSIFSYEVNFDLPATDRDL